MYMDFPPFRIRFDDEKGEAFVERIHDYVYEEEDCECGECFVCESKVEEYDQDDWLDYAGFWGEEDE